MDAVKPNKLTVALTGASLFLPLIAYIVAVGLNAYLNIPGVSPFNATIGDLSHKYDTGITPSDATFAIWGLIYIWQGALVIYLTTLVCRKVGGNPVYTAVSFIPASFIAVYSLNLFSNPAWIVVFLQEQMYKGAILLVLGVLTCMIAIATSVVRLNATGAMMESKGLKGDIWATRILVQNGVALYLAWITCATAIQVVVVLVYFQGMDMVQASWGALIALNIFVLIWFAVEMILDQYLRYVFAHWIAYIIAFVGIYSARFDKDVPYTIYALVLLALVSALALTKLTVMIIRAVLDPIRFPTSDVKKVAYGVHYVKMQN